MEVGPLWPKRSIAGQIPDYNPIWPYPASATRLDTPCIKWWNKPNLGVVVSRRFQDQVNRLRSSIVLKLFPTGGHPSAIAFTAALVLFFCRQGPRRVKEHARGLVGTRSEEH